MTQTNLLLLATMLITTIACKKEQKLPRITDIAATGTIYNYATDSSGKVKTVVVYDRAVGLKNDVSTSLPNDYVLIGGGGYSVSDTGYFMTASYPDDSLTTWTVKFSQPAKLNNIIYAYAVGLKLEGLTKAQLKANIQLMAGIDSASVDSSYVLIGGGTKVTYAGKGKRLIKSRPGGNTWYGATTGYLPADSATMTTYAIGIKKDIPVFGSLNVEHYAEANPLTNNKNSSVIIKLDDNWVTACPGAELIGTIPGRRLTTMYPLTRAISIFSVRDSSDTNGSTAGYMIKLRKGN